MLSGGDRPYHLFRRASLSQSWNDENSRGLLLLRHGSPALSNINNEVSPAWCPEGADREASPAGRAGGGRRRGWQEDRAGLHCQRHTPFSRLTPYVARHPVLKPDIVIR